MKFEAHGSFRLVLCEHVILCSLTSSFNYEAARELDRNVRDLLEKSPRKANLIDSRRWGFATPDASEVLADLNRWSIGKGLVRSAHITPGKLMTSIIDGNLSPDGPRYRRRYFSDLQSARTWLADEGFPISDEELADFSCRPD